MVVPVLCGIAVLASCAKDPLQVDRNRPPQTFLVAAPAESASASYRIHLYWRGEDPDGYIAGFLWSWDDSSIAAFRFTTKTDSVFELTVNDSMALIGGTGQQQPGTTKPHTFYIRAVDNLGKVDPVPTIFNHRIYNASTDKPTVRFVGAIPSPAGIDTLCDQQPFTICWSGSDSDGYVAFYRWDVGVFSSPLQTDTCAVFNDPGVPGSVPLISGVYTFTVTAVDNAFARSDPASGGKLIMVVNHDPETQILDANSGTTGAPVGYYIQKYSLGFEVAPVVRTFSEGDTIPFRSTVYWKWTGSDAACNEQNVITGYNAVLRGTRNGGDPYIIGNLDVLCVDNGDTIRFDSNDPARVLTKCGFQSLVLDSLDAGYSMRFNVASRDISDRIDGTPASFLFHCNFQPRLDSLTVEDTMMGTQRAKRFRWYSEDPEDGYTYGAKITLDSQQQIFTEGYVREIVIPESQFKSFSSLNPHSFELQVIDRAGFYSPPEQTRVVTFDVTYP